jgi:hypothetical protein
MQPSTGSPQALPSLSPSKDFAVLISCRTQDLLEGGKDRRP